MYIGLPGVTSFGVPPTILPESSVVSSETHHKMILFKRRSFRKFRYYAVYLREKMGKIIIRR